MAHFRKIVLAYLLAAAAVCVIAYYFWPRQFSSTGKLLRPVSELVWRSISPGPSGALIEVDVEDIPAGYKERGTSFRLADRLWLTARHVAGDGCGEIDLVVNGANVPATVKYLDPNADLAVLQTPATPGPVLDIERSRLSASADAFAFGFPQGDLGGTEDELMGRARMKLGGRLMGTAPVLTWVETQRYPSTIDSLAGISGGPMLDDKGNVIGIIVAASVRRGRNYTVAPEILLEIQRELGLASSPNTPDGTWSPSRSIEGAASALSQNARIAETFCIPP